MRGPFRAPERVPLPGTREEGAALARRYERRVWRLAIIGNVVGALPLLLGTIAGAGADIDPDHAMRHGVLNFVNALFYIALLAIVWIFVVRHVFEPTARWLSSARPAADTDRTSLRSVPRHLALLSIVGWAGGAAYTIPFSVLVIYRGFHVPPFIWVQYLVGEATGAATAVMLVYLLLERTLRPLRGLAQRGSASQPRTIGALPRLLMAFGVGVAGPLFALAVGLIGLNARQKAGVFPSIWVAIATVIFAGFVVAVVSAQAVTDPIETIRGGFRRLKDGDLGVELDVDEPGEIGQLQAGFNELVEGLRDRERMRDVFVRIVGKDVAQHALENASGLVAEPRQATAMFVDIIGSTPLAQSSSPQEYLTKLNSFFDVVVRSVEDAGGVVNQFQGDGALCIFGAPTDQPDHAVRALRASRELRQELDDFAQASGIQAVIGVSTGDVVAGHVGTAERYEFTVVGDAVNEAKRLAEEAKSAETKVLVSDATIHAAEGELANWHEAGSVHLRGRSAPTTTHTPNA